MFVFIDKVEFVDCGFKYFNFVFLIIMIVWFVICLVVKYFGYII